MLLSNPRIFGDRKRQKVKIFLNVGVVRSVHVVGFLAVLACLLVQACRLFDAILLTLAKMNGVPSFCPLSRFACGVLCLNMALFRVFRAFLA